ncbi:MAG TPA: methylmalonyl Co-A mutase-associated GTPase MeaB [Acidothermaceae bacterium]|nr:methylmalonyl Co-A mutase-associated GTPase MeaB [Acidothermaceae bacterium]
MTSDVEGLVQAARAHDPRALGKLLSMVEDDDPALPTVMAALLGAGVQTPYVIGLTGAPGVGKSTTTSALIALWRQREQRVGVLAVDPSSPFTGGALLGDRVRMQTHATDSDVFIRSMASRGQLGGMAASTPQAVRVLESTGFDVVLVETVGVGQAEVDIAATADTTIVLLAPGMGDGIQAAKAGLLEVADLLVVNKCDRDGADAAIRELHNMIATGGDREPGEWRPVVVRAVATAAGGIDELVEAIDKHRAWLESSGEGERRRVRRAAQEIRSIALAMLTARVGLRADDPRLVELAAGVVAGTIDTYAAAGRLASAV